MSRAATVPISAAAAAFDRMAESYDAVFTRSLIGRAQRAQVWKALEETFPMNTRILELNCGTGEDALFLSRGGRSILACDASSAMIEVATKRKRTELPDGNLEFRLLPTENLSELKDEEQFDGAFSNFSGLNCVSDLSQVAEPLSSLVRNGGKLLFCLSTRLCVAELLWYLSHGNIKKALRRLPGHAVARFEEVTLPVFYPTIASIRRTFAPWFRLKSFRAVGLFVPPSYVEKNLQGREKTLALLEKMDDAVGSWPLLRAVGDHVLLKFERYETKVKGS